MTALRDFIKVLQKAVEVERETNTLKIHGFEPLPEEVSTVATELKTTERTARFLLQCYFVAYGKHSYALYGPVYKAMQVVKEVARRDFRVRVINNCKQYGYPSALVG